MGRVEASTLARRGPPDLNRVRGQGPFRKGPRKTDSDVRTFRTPLKTDLPLTWVTGDVWGGSASWFPNDGTKDGPRGTVGFW